MKEPLIYLDGRFLPPGQAALSLHDAGFVLGATITEMCRTFGHRLFRWEDHLVRFGRSCRSAEIYPPLPIEEITRHAQQLVEHNAGLLGEDDELGLVLFATPGPIGWYFGEEGGAGDRPATFGMHTFPLPWARYGRIAAEGARLVVPGVRAAAPECVDPRIKHRSRIHWWLADREVQRVEPGAQALLQTADGYLTETAAANFLIVERGRLVSPPRHRILEGVSWLTVRETAADLGIDFAERDLTLYDALHADEAILTSTPYCLAGVRSLQGRPMPFPGPTFLRLREAWTQRVGRPLVR